MHVRHHYHQFCFSFAQLVVCCGFREAAGRVRAGLLVVLLEPGRDEGRGGDRRGRRRRGRAEVDVPGPECLPEAPQPLQHRVPPVEAPRSQPPDVRALAPTGRTLARRRGARPSTAPKESTQHVPKTGRDPGSPGRTHRIC